MNGLFLCVETSEVGKYRAVILSYRYLLYTMVHAIRPCSIVQTALPEMRKVGPGLHHEEASTEATPQHRTTDAQQQQQDTNSHTQLLGFADDLPPTGTTQTSLSMPNSIRTLAVAEDCAYVL